MHYSGTASPLHGGSQGDSEAIVALQSGEYIHGVELALNTWGNHGPEYIHAIKLTSNLATYGWFGSDEFAYKYESVCLRSAKLAYLSGSGGSDIDRLELYFHGI